MLAENVALLAPAGTVTEDGTFTADELLERLIESPLVEAAALVVTVQVSVPAPLTLVLAQVNALSVAACFVPLPCKVTEAAAVGEVLVITLSWPLESVLSFGLKWTFRVRLLPAASVTGRFPWPSTLNAELDNVS
jgi:hypothetical protein